MTLTRRQFLAQQREHWHKLLAESVSGEYAPARYDWVQLDSETAEQIERDRKDYWNRMRRDLSADVYRTPAGWRYDA